jgi:glycosyltransferase involved in cell wall biosynthesis
MDEDDFIVEMDADLSHDPRDLPSLLSALEKTDVVVGSRYLPGARIENWPWSRTLLSRLANLWARFVLGIPLSDYTTGYRAYRARVFRELDYHRIHAKGYIVLTEMAWQLFEKGFSFSEVPITFVNRRRGESNLSLLEIISAFVNILVLRLESWSSALVGRIYK